MTQHKLELGPSLFAELPGAFLFRQGQPVNMKSPSEQLIASKKPVRLQIDEAITFATQVYCCVY